MPGKDEFAVGAFVEFIAEGEVIREEYADQMPTVSGGFLILQSEEGALFLPLDKCDEVRVRYDFRPREEASRMMLAKMGLSEEEIDAELAKEAGYAEGSGPENGAEEGSVSEGPDAPIIRLDFGGSDETPEDEGETS